MLLADSCIGIKTSGLELISFILDADFRIEHTAVHINPRLSLLKKPFIELLAEESRPLWLHVQDILPGADGFVGTFQLTLIDQQKRFPALCSVNRLVNSGRAVVNAVVFADVRPFHGKIPEEVTVNHEMIRLEKLYHYIIEHLDEPLPSAFDLAKLLGTNDHTLKESFRRTFGTSIYQF
ncbi:helix-turn-helix transcriptional regulator [Flavobacterium selenitireducens]|uniref:helix-turn-helix transcriptional regulator n=1 Tax=Flavobacterium selenitireducens TaxID=2722704 RepID=UPI00168AA79B|nr:helix-turn-helix transcriptional regulator [Flavobacterium selenitireducens]MBD3581299.1 helix-turn-helix transcriptional regulator [Flavobacterium selenitireducens]